MFNAHTAECLSRISGIEQDIPKRRLNHEVQDFEQGAGNYEISVRSTTYYQRVFLTQNRFLGLGPKVMSEGDEVCMYFEGRVLFLLWRVMSRYIFVRKCYPHNHDLICGKFTGH